MLAAAFAAVPDLAAPLYVTDAANAGDAMTAETPAIKAKFFILVSSLIIKIFARK
jgi:hypothetical protein